MTTNTRVKGEMANAFDMMVPVETGSSLAAKVAEEERVLADKVTVVDPLVKDLAKHISDGELFGLVKRFEEKKLSDKLNSWMGRGDRQPITAEEVELVFGPEFFVSLNELLPAGTGAAAPAVVSEVLPMVVSRFTRSGQIPPQRVLARSLAELQSNLALLQKKLAETR